MNDRHNCDLAGDYDSLCPTCFEGRAWQIAEAFEGLVVDAAGYAAIDASMLGDDTLDDYCDSGALLAQAFETVVGRPFVLATQDHAEDHDGDLCDIAEAHGYQLLRQMARRRRESCLI